MTPIRRASAADCRRSPRLPAEAGSSLLEAMVVIGLLGVLATYAGTTLVDWRQRTRLEAAARRLSVEVNRACAFAAASGRTHGLSLVADAEDLRWVLVADGDGDGISPADIAAAIDAAVAPPGGLESDFPGIEPGRPFGVPTIAGGASGTHGVAFGGTTIVSCSADGGARAGTVYLRAAAGEAAALRVYGPTARLSLWWWEPAVAAWARMR